MKNWTIGKRIIFGFALIIVVVLALGLYAYARIAAIRSHSDRIAKLSIPAMELVTRAQRNATDFDRMIYIHIGSSDKADMARLEEEMAANSKDNTATYEQLATILTVDKGHELLEKTKAARAEYARVRDQVLASSRQGTNNAAAYGLARTEMDPLSKQYLAALAELLSFIRNEADDTSKNIQVAVQSSQVGITVGLLAAVAMGVMVAFVIIRGTSLVLQSVSTTLNDSSNQTASAAAQVSSASQMLAQGAGEQASSLEETSSSLEEMASMTKRNADHSEKVNDLAKQARQAADKGAADMQSMSQAMQSIKTSSDDIAKIIKTIDEIAFQTNILALNAAVEAARAGDAGMGFAVVADEVRNLAQRSAQAAKETAAKIEGAIGNTSHGVELSGKVSRALNEIVAKVREVDELASEVANASREQTQGITQINTAVGQMDKVTQANAASAEESAAAAEELNAQAAVMRQAVGELVRLVGGSQQTTGRNSTAWRESAASHPSMVPKAPAPRAKVHASGQPPVAAAAANGKSRLPSEALAATAPHNRSEIPLDADFKNF